MGINRFFKYFESTGNKCTLETFKDKTIVIDGNAMLYKGAYSCALDLFYGRQTFKHFSYCLSRIELMRFYNIKPIFVFDGKVPNIKQNEELGRDLEKERNVRKVDEALQNDNIQMACEYASRAIHISSQTVNEFIRLLDESSIEYVVSPFEADPQMVYLCSKGYADGIISEDSDLMVYMAIKKISVPLITKLTSDGQCVEFNLDNILNSKISQKMTHELFINICILAGCDYLENIPKLGLSKIINNITSMNICDGHNSFLIDQYLEKIESIKNIEIPEDYRRNFLVARDSFLYHIIYNPDSESIESFTPINNNNTFAQWTLNIDPRRLKDNLKCTLRPLTIHMANTAPLEQDQCDGYFNIKKFFCPDMDGIKNSLNNSKIDTKNKEATTVEMNQVNSAVKKMRNITINIEPQTKRFCPGSSSHGIKLNNNGITADNNTLIIKKPIGLNNVISDDPDELPGPNTQCYKRDSSYLTRNDPYIPKKIKENPKSENYSNLFDSLHF